MSTKPGRFRVSEAARKIGITPGRLRQLIRVGECAAFKVTSEIVRVGYYWEVPAKEIERLKNIPPAQGRPRIGRAS